MNPLLRWLTSPEWTHIVGALLHSLWQGAIIALALAVLMRRLANPVTRYRCALVTLGLVVMAGIVTWAVLNAPKSAVSIAITIPVTEPAIAPVAAAALNRDSDDKIVALGRMPPPPATKYWIAWLAVVWMLGAVAMLLRAGIKVAGAENLRRSCQPLNDDHMLALVAEARQAVGLVRQIRVAVTDKLTSPAVVGVIVPTLILPLSLFTTLTPEQIRFILLHELAHIRRGDYFANLFQLLAEALLFFNPAVWWISHQIRREREASCDALAIELSGAPADYARTLVRVAENILQPATHAALAFGDDQREPSSLADRVQRLLVPGYRPALRLTWRAMLASLLVSGSLLFLSAVGARNVVGAITSNTTETVSKPIDNTNSTNSNQRQTGGLSVPKTNGIQQSQSSSQASDKDREAISRKLDQIKFDKVIYQGVPLFEVVRSLNDEARARDSDQKGINFVVDPNVPGGTNQISLTNCPTINMAKDAIGVTLREVLDGIVKGSSAKIHYSIEEYAVVFGLGDPIEPLQMRTFNLDLDVISAALGVPTLARLTNDSPAASNLVIDGRTYEASGLLVALRERIRGAGVDIDRPGAAIFLNERERQGKLLVNATKKDLDTIEALLQTLSSSQLTTRTFMVGPVELARALGHIGLVQVTNAAAMVQELMAKAGVDLKPPKTAVFKDTLGLLMVRATKTELDMIEKFLMQTNQRAASGKLSPGNPGEAKAMIPVPKANLAGSVEENSTNLLLRVYKVDAKAMVKALDVALGNNVGSGTESTNDSRTLLPDIQKFFAILGLDLQPPKTVFFNETKGQLLVRATLADLNTIEQVLQVLNNQAPQVNIRTMFVEIPGDGSGDLLLANLISSPPESKQPPSGKHAAISSTGFAGSNGFTGILTEPQFKAMLTALQQRKDVKILSQQDVTTLSGRQAQMQTVEMRSIVTGLRTNLTPGETKGQVATEQLPFGQVLDIIPFISSDGHTIAITVIPTVTEFLGYDKPTELSLPRFRLRQITTSANVWDGQTLVLGGFVAQEVIRKPDGSEVRQRSDKAEKRSLLVFITATIIDPAGNRANPVEESPPSSPPISK
jgi:beta-lactamase regulating signal transducer with metallopeptidase domain